jgi:hypothetical protein
VKDGTTYTETQRFDQWWLRMLFAALNLVFAYAVWLQVAEGRGLGDDPLSLDMLVLVWLSLGVFTVLFLRTRLITRVDASGVHVRFVPWQRQGRQVPWSQVQGCRVRQYRPLIDFGGWGMRSSMGGRMEGYTTSGDRALELDLGERRSLLIGTQRPEELAAVLRALGRG